MKNRTTVSTQGITHGTDQALEGGPAVEAGDSRGCTTTRCWSAGAGLNGGRPWRPVTGLRVFGPLSWGFKDHRERSRLEIAHVAPFDLAYV